eukprot:503336_1
MTEETEQQTKQLKDHVQSTQSTEDLLLLIKHFPLDSLKAFASKQIANEILNPNQISKIYHTILPINDLLPDAILQQILSFDNLYHPRLVCRQWHALSIQNETNYMHEIYQTININDFPKDGKNWVVHPKRKYLHQVEKDLGFKGPINCTDYSGENGFEALIHTLCDDGDRLLLHGTSITKILIFIRLGNKVKFCKDPTDGVSNLISVLTISISEKKHNSNMIFQMVEGDYDDQCGYGYQYANQHDCRCCD